MLDQLQIVFASFQKNEVDLEDVKILTVDERESDSED